MRRGHRPAWGALSLGVCLATGGLVVGTDRLVWANGAFPDSFGILVPPDRPDEITLSTNFGLITSEDGGKSWTWSCEQEVSSLASLYQLGPAPLNRLYALSERGLIHSDDLSCTWAVSGGTAQDARPTDFFPDPTDAMHLLVLAVPNSTELAAAAVYQSTDGGRTVGPPLYHGALRGDLTGIESARADPRVIYLASYDTPGPQPQMLKSTDRGATWSGPVNLESSIGQNTFRIIAIDPVDAQKIFLLVTEPQSQALAISFDGGATFTTPVRFGVALTAFARLASGVILVAGLESDAQGNPVGSGFRSSDGGRTFTPWSVPQLRALVEREGKLYGAADNFVDGFALGVSTDEGMTFRPMMKFGDVSSIRRCLQQVCADTCHRLAMTNIWPDRTCQPPAAASGASGCAVGGESAIPLSLPSVAAAALVWSDRRRRASRGGACGGDPKNLGLSSPGRAMSKAISFMCSPHGQPRREGKRP